MTLRWMALPILAIGIVLLGCFRNTPDLTRSRIAVGDQQRPYYYHVPRDLPEDGPFPLLVMFHGYGQSPAIIAQDTGYNAIADREGFIVAYPRGIRRGFDVFDDMDRDDVAYVREMIAHIQMNHPVDPERIYAAGASNGGFMVFRLACEAPELFAAAATVMALMPQKIAEEHPPDRPMPMLIIHGTDDPVIPYEGDRIWRFPLNHEPVLSIEETVDFWVEHNGSEAEADMKAVPNRDREDGTHTTRKTYSGGRNGAEVVLYTVHGGGHTWPGGNERYIEGLAGARSNDFDASEVIWDFLRRHSRPAD